MVVSDADSDASGESALSIEPALKQSPADGEAITVASVPFKVSLTEDKSMLRQDGPLYSLPTEIKMIEDTR